MSSQKGNVKRTRAQKHKNVVGFKNDRDDTTVQNKIINALTVSGCCHKCKEIVEWKIKYKKYKPLSQPKTCTICKQKTVRRAYYIVCQLCAEEKQCCAKCGHQNKVVLPPQHDASEEARQQTLFRHELRTLTEKKRRKFLRLMASGQLTQGDSPTSFSAMKKMEEESDHESDDDGDEHQAEQGVFQAEQGVHQAEQGKQVEPRCITFDGSDNSLPQAASSIVLAAGVQDMEAEEGAANNV